MIEYEGGPLWQIPLLIIALPFIATAVFCGAIAALICGKFTFKWRAWG